MREYTGSKNTGIPACAPSGVALRCQDKSNRAGITPSSGLQTRWAHRPTACVPLWLRANEFLKARIVANRIPFPTVL